MGYQDFFRYETPLSPAEGELHYETCTTEVTDWSFSRVRVSYILVRSLSFQFARVHQIKLLRASTAFVALFF